jgi:hypothetical protein
MQQEYHGSVNAGVQYSTFYSTAFTVPPITLADPHSLFHLSLLNTTAYVDTYRATSGFHFDLEQRRDLFYGWKAFGPAIHS